MTVLILASQTDTPVDVVVRRLVEHDVPVFRADLSWFPRHLVLDGTIDPDGTWTGVLRTEHRMVAIEEIRSIWYRGPGAFQLPDGMTDVERAYAHREARLGLGGVLAAVDARWVNHPNRTAEAIYKPVQLSVAARCGLRIVPTTVTNAPDAVRRAAQASPHGIVRKSLGPSTVTEGDALTVAFTHLLSQDDLADLSGVDVTATQVQDWVDKRVEARVVAVGETMFTVLIRAQSPAARVDWRADYPSLAYEWVDTPDDVAVGMRRYMRELGLVYAAADFAVDADGRWIFLESNSSGQYFWLEAHTGAPITSALIELLAGQAA